MWIEVQRKNKKIPSPTASPNWDIKTKRPSPLRPINSCSGSKSTDEMRKRIRPPPGFPELENIEPAIHPRAPDFCKYRRTEEIVNWRDKNVSLNHNLWLIYLWLIFRTFQNWRGYMFLSKPIMVIRFQYQMIFLYEIILSQSQPNWLHLDQSEALFKKWKKKMKRKDEKDSKSIQKYSNLN